MQDSQIWPEASASMTNPPAPGRIPETENLTIVWDYPAETKRMRRWDPSHTPQMMTA